MKSARVWGAWLALVLVSACASLHAPQDREARLTAAAERAKPFFMQFEERLIRTRYLALRPLGTRRVAEDEWLRRYGEFRAELGTVLGPALADYERRAVAELRAALAAGFNDAELAELAATTREAVWDEYAARNAVAALLVGETTAGRAPSPEELAELAQRARALSQENEAFAQRHKGAIDRLTTYRVARIYYGLAATAATNQAIALTQALRANTAVAGVTRKWRSLAAPPAQ
jgi:hypothetical protein